MSTTATVEMPADRIALAQTLRREPSLRVEVLQHAAAIGCGHAPLLAIRDTAEELSPVEITSRLQADPSVDEAELLAEGEGELVYQCAWNEDEVDFDLGAPEAVTVTILDMTARAGTWTCQLVCADRETLSTLHDHWDQQDAEITVRRIRSDGWPGDGSRVHVTESQATALIEAFSSGFYGVPRGTDLCELADEVGISHQALSERLRRGHGQLVEQTLISEVEQDGDPPSELQRTETSAD